MVYPLCQEGICFILSPRPPPGASSSPTLLPACPACPPQSDTARRRFSPVQGSSSLPRRPAPATFLSLCTSSPLMAPFAAPVLSVAADVVQELDGEDALYGLWALFTKCKESLKDGRRLENISWRLWYRE
ncbi:DUF1752-domain-containing protein, partial [Wolfiporia cocos MD-104 SS10]